MALSSTLRIRQNLQKQVNLAWAELTSSMNKISSDCQVRPDQVTEVFDFEHQEGKFIKVRFKPVVFRVKELAKSGQSKLFVTVEGQLNFSVDRDLHDPQSCYFVTEVGYFRIAGTKLKHILGLHYDFDGKNAMHPVYHAQLSSMEKHLEAIKAHYGQDFELPPDMNQMTDVSQHVRLPTAHMDPLSVFIQLLADHLLNVNSGPVQQQAFDDARAAAMFFKSDLNHAPRMHAVVDDNCFRGPRWYL